MWLFWIPVFAGMTERQGMTQKAHDKKGK